MLGSNAFLERLVGVIERTERLDRVADTLASTAESLLGGRRTRTALSGTAAGHPAHPGLVSLPIGAWLAALYLDVAHPAGRLSSSRRLVDAGLLATVPTVLTGASDWAYTTGAERRVGFVHAMSNYAAIGLFGASSVARRREHAALGTALAGGGAGLLVAAGWLGAHLSYARGVGVDTTAFQVAPAEWADVLPDEQLPPDTPTLVHADGVPVLLLRRGTTVHALADRCTHRGAPLHEGALAGDCIVCPWHDSSFRITDGQVVDGPATRSQPVYEVRLRYGSIQVRRREEPGSLRTNPVS